MFYNASYIQVFLWENENIKGEYDSTIMKVLKQ